MNSSAIITVTRLISTMVLTVGLCLQFGFTGFLIACGFVGMDIANSIERDA